MQTLRDLPALRAALLALRRDGKPVALVTTMGALHDGHMALVEEARRHAGHVAVSIFVNPKQFGPNEDLDAYPRREASDAHMLQEAGVDILWAPTVEVMYPAGFSTNISLSGVTEGLDGAARPGHFDGVATVVAKLFSAVRPDLAIFGEKDFQQLAVIRRMTADLGLGVDVIGAATVRTSDGLALSSRNAYLSPDELHRAVTLPQALEQARAAVLDGMPVAAVLAEAKQQLAAAGFGPIDYVALVDAATLEPLDVPAGEMRLIAAARIGKTRLIDNIRVFSGTA